MSATAKVIDPNGDVVEHCFQLGDEPRLPQPIAPEPVSAPAVLPVAAKVVVPAAIASAAPGKTETVNLKAVLKQLKDRLRTVEREIKARKTLEQERDQIRRLIGAATNERDNLRRLRSAG